MRNIWALVLLFGVAGLMAGPLSSGKGVSNMFEHNIETRLEIPATASNVWDAILAFEDYPTWNPFILRISGEPKVGQELDVTIRPVGGSAMTFSPTVQHVELERELRWKGKFLFTGLFDGEHYFLIEPKASGGVTLVHGETFSGALVPFFKSQLNIGTKAGFDAMNQALRARMMSAQSN